MILFLDFDGVLHPYPLHVDDQHAELLMHTPLLWSLLRRHPELQVVVSSSWRERFSMDYLVDFLTYGGGEELAGRIAGATPVISHLERDRECMAWLESNGHVGTPWLALDDQPALFRDCQAELYQVNQRTGLTASDLDAISSMVQRSYRTDLIERLLAAECELEFISIREARDLMPAIAEIAVHAPIVRWLAGERDLRKLAKTLPVGLQGLFLAKNGQSPLTE